MRSDSLSSLLAMQKRASRSAALSTVLCELALDTVEFYDPVSCATHIPGLSNDVADALSRQAAPEAPAFPPF